MQQVSIIEEVGDVVGQQKVSWMSTGRFTIDIRLHVVTPWVHGCCLNRHPSYPTHSNYAQSSLLFPLHLSPINTSPAHPAPLIPTPF